MFCGLLLVSSKRNVCFRGDICFTNYRMAHNRFGGGYAIMGKFW